MNYGAVILYTNNIITLLLLKKKKTYHHEGQPQGIIVILIRDFGVLLTQETHLCLSLDVNKKVMLVYYNLILNKKVATITNEKKHFFSIWYIDQNYEKEPRIKVTQNSKSGTSPQHFLSSKIIKECLSRSKGKKNNKYVIYLITWNSWSLS